MKILENCEDNEKIVYRLVKNRRNPFESAAKVLELEGKMIWKEEKILETWEDYCNKLYKEEDIGDEQNQNRSNTPTNVMTIL